ncbi:AcrR family transcriptional regulator [Methanolinea mesophila]|uniref:TetR/AcrR family transcriptional regulator n=1 Tax=Methanolinea mesophila TaxID=547055 RepID=UPI001AE169F1|nr:TetR/AcrR family transcriptional regulator [Methanolinea mesophila]MBP1928896.1 AcrR family transcriptional regulator [Methanolinea mesophila]
MARIYPEYKDEVRKRIVVAAHDIFHEKGYANTKMSDIAVAMGVTKPTIYNYFDTKENLFIAVAEHERRLLEELILQSFSGRDFVEGAGIFFDNVMGEFLSHIGPESVAITTRDENLKSIIVTDREEFLKVVAGFLAERQKAGEIREDVDVRVLACTFNALFQGLLIYAMQGMDIDELRTVWNTTVRKLTRIG